MTINEHLEPTDSAKESRVLKTHLSDSLLEDQCLKDIMGSSQPVPDSSETIKDFMKSFTEQFREQLTPTDEEWEMIQAANAALREKVALEEYAQAVEQALKAIEEYHGCSQFIADMQGIGNEEDGE